MDGGSGATPETVAPGELIPLCAARRASFTCAMDWKRSAGDFCKQRARMFCNGGGTGSGAGCLCKMAAMMAMVESPVKARRPLSIS